MSRAGSLYENSLEDNEDAFLVESGRAWADPSRIEEYKRYSHQKTLHEHILRMLIILVISNIF